MTADHGFVLFRRSTARRVVLALAILLLVVLAGAFARGLRGSGADDPAAATSTRDIRLKSGDFVRRLRLTGTTEATRSYVVTTPLLAGASQGSMVVTRLAAAGATVKPGDLLVEFDRQNQEKNALDKKAEYEDLVQQIAQKRAEQDAARVKDEAEIARAKNAVENFELEVLKNEMLSRILAEKNDQDLEEARAKFASLKQGFDLKRQAAAAELRILEIKRDRAQAAMTHALENAHAMTVISPLEGLVVPKLTWRGNGPADIQEGDEMFPGAPVLEVVNQASVLVRARVNQTDLTALQPGMSVVVRLDAYPDLRMPGRLGQISPVGLAGSFSARVRSFSAVVTIDKPNPRMLPDLTAAIDVELERVRNAIVVPRDAVHVDGSDATVSVRTPAGITTRPVTLGPSDEVSVVVARGLREGEVVVR
jgi:multidrug efflux pump subunit AcrA (membrane-fusion protein)